VRGAVAVHGGTGWWGLTIYEYENIYGFTMGVLGKHLLRFVYIYHHEVDEQVSGRWTSACKCILESLRPDAPSRQRLNARSLASDTADPAQIHGSRL
jgi:hypothetical protein